MNDYKPIWKQSAKSMVSGGSGALCMAPFEVIAVQQAMRRSGGFTLGTRSFWGNNYQAIVTPDGFCVSLIGPFIGPTNDWNMWRRSGCDEAIREVMEGMKPFIYMVIQPIMHLLESLSLSVILVAGAGCHKTSSASTKPCHLFGLLLSNPLAGRKSYGHTQRLIRALQLAGSL